MAGAAEGEARGGAKGEGPPSPSGRMGAGGLRGPRGGEVRQNGQGRVTVQANTPQVMFVEEAREVPGRRDSGDSGRAAGGAAAGLQLERRVGSSGSEEGAWGGRRTLERGGSSSADDEGMGGARGVLPRGRGSKSPQRGGSRSPRRRIRRNSLEGMPRLQSSDEVCLCGARGVCVCLVCVGVCGRWGGKCMCETQMVCGVCSLCERDVLCEL